MIPERAIRVYVYDNSVTGASVEVLVAKCIHAMFVLQSSEFIERVVVVTYGAVCAASLGGVLPDHGSYLGLAVITISHVT
jgi:hypothetical protein